MKYYGCYVPNKRKLKELVSFGLGLTYTPRYLANGIPFISSKNISNDYLDLSDINFISLDEFNGCSKSAKPKYGDILFTRVGSNLGHPVVYESTNDICIFVSLGFLRCKDLINNYYLKHWMNSPNFWQQVRKKVGGSSKFNLNTGWLQEFDVPYRDFEEQQKIAFFLNKIDERIRTQNKIIEDLKTLRKGIIDSLFKPSKSEEQLSKFLSERKTYSEKGEGFEHVTLSKEGICPKTERYDRDFLVTTEDKNYKITKLNDICYNPANLKFGVICLNTYGDAIFSPIYVTFEVKNIDPYYLSLFLTSNRFIKKALRYQQGTVYERMAVNPEDFCKCKIPLNDNVTIQQITKVVSLLDSKIKVEENIIQKYRIQKDCLLSNLFI